MKNSVLNSINRIIQLDQVKDRVSKFWYRYVSNVTRDCPEVCFLNYGFAPLNGQQIDLDSSDEQNRMYIQLYHAVASSIDLAGKNLLEMSSGRGGGANYVMRYLEPKTLVGVDRAPNAVQFCRQQHRQPGLSFTCGDAQRMPFAKNSFDVVLSVEASHDYPKITHFLSEVRRVLRPGGHFLYTDFRTAEQCPAWRRQIDAMGLSVIEHQDITANVLRGLELNTEHTLGLIRKLAPTPLRPIFKQFAGTKGSVIYERFAKRRSEYHRYVLQKT